MRSLGIGANPTPQLELSSPGNCMSQRVLANQDLRRVRNKTLFPALCYLVTEDPSSPTRVEGQGLYLHVAERLEFASTVTSPSPWICASIEGSWRGVG